MKFFSLGSLPLRDIGVGTLNWITNLLHVPYVFFYLANLPINTLFVTLCFNLWTIPLDSPIFLIGLHIYMYEPKSLRLMC